MSYTKSDAAIDTCSDIAARLRQADTGNMTQAEFVDLTDQLYEMASAVETAYDASGYPKTGDECTKCGESVYKDDEGYMRDALNDDLHPCQFS